MHMRGERFFKLRAVEDDAARRLGAQAEERFGELRAPGAHDPGKAEDFAGPHVEADVAEAFAAEAAHAEARLADLARPCGPHGPCRTLDRDLHAAHRVDNLGVAVAVEQAR